MWLIEEVEQVTHFGLRLLDYVFVLLLALHLSFLLLQFLLSEETLSLRLGLHLLLLIVLVHYPVVLLPRQQLVPQL